MATAPYLKLRAYHSAMDLVVAVYALTGSFPRSDVYGLSTQLRRAAVSVVTNLVEGQSRYGARQFVVLLDVAVGCLREVECLIAIARRLDHVSDAKRHAGRSRPTAAWQRRNSCNCSR